MSETPQETLEKYALDKYCRPEIREAIRAVLELVDVQYRVNEELGRDLEQTEGVARGYMLAAEKAEAALLDAQQQEAQDIEALGKLEAERDEWRDTARSEMAGRAAAEAEVARLRDIISPSDAAAYEEGMAALQARVRALEGALREWREAESWPDCAACSVLDAALAGALA